VIRTTRPDETYNLGAQSHVGVSFRQPGSTGDVDGVGAIRLRMAAFAARKLRFI